MEIDPDADIEAALENGNVIFTIIISMRLRVYNYNYDVCVRPWKKVALM